MATKRERKNGSWEFCFQKKGLLPGRVWFSFDTLEEGEAYEARAEALLEKGVIPPEMMEGGLDLVSGFLALYEVSLSFTSSDREVVGPVTEDVGRVRVTVVDYAWVENWVARMKERGLSPSTLKKRVGLLARCFDWGMRTGKLSLINNPFRLLPKGYATKDVGSQTLWDGQRDRRLERRTITLKGVGGEEKVFHSEEEAIRSVLKDSMETLLFDMALETAMRMREMFTLEWGQVNLGQRTIFLDRTKNGDKRQVPISSVLYALLKPLKDGADEKARVFPWWDGNTSSEALKRCSVNLSHRYASRFEKAGCPDLRFHDLRHEGTARVYERTRFTDLQVASITGHKDLRQLKRYANLRASSLVEGMW